MIRYRASPRVEHACCWGASVEDLTKPVMIGREHYKEQFEMICECENIETAAVIAEAMNAKVAA